MLIEPPKVVNAPLITCKKLMEHAEVSECLIRVGGREERRSALESSSQGKLRFSEGL